MVCFAEGGHIVDRSHSQKM